MDRRATVEASQLLRQHWVAGTRIDALPRKLRPVRRDEGYAIQAVLEALPEEVPFGWKIAATSAAGQQHIGVDGPLAGRLLRSMVVDPGALVPLRGTAMRVAEPEFVFRLAHDLTPRGRPYDRDEVLDAVASVHPGIEVPDSRYVDFAAVGGPQLIADNACGHRFTVGEQTPASWRDIDLQRHAVRAEVVGRYERTGSGANVLGDPAVALTWLVNEVVGLGLRLRAGAFVTTGTCMTPLAVEPGDEVTVDFGELGTTRVRFSA